MKGKDSARTSIMEDLEKNIAIPLQEARYENARWWRNINRMMAFVGIIVLICVVSISDPMQKLPILISLLDCSCCGWRSLQLKSSYTIPRHYRYQRVHYSVTHILHFYFNPYIFRHIGIFGKSEANGTIWRFANDKWLSDDCLAGRIGA